MEMMINGRRTLKNRLSIWKEKKTFDVHKWKLESRREAKTKYRNVQGYGSNLLKIDSFNQSNWLKRWTQKNVKEGKRGKK